MMELNCESRYILLPASWNAKPKRLVFLDGREPVLDLAVALDADEPGFLFPVDIARFRGKTLGLTCEPEVDFLPVQTDDPPLDYAGKYRPWAHFTARRGWINDPNGLVWYRGKYRMYFQHNPAATTWENMHWGAAESKDLVHWRELGDVLFPDAAGTIFSGSGIVDRENVSGLKTGEEDPILFFYTAAGGTSQTSQGSPFTQNLAYSTDGGRTLVKWPGNPIISQLAPGNRDPKVIRYEPEHCYILALFLENHEFALFRSEDLLHWTELQRLTLPEDWECPDFYPLPADGDPENLRWVFSAASDRYLIGAFDGRRFTPEGQPGQLNWGDVSYAAQSWSDEPGGRRIRTAFIKQVVPGQPFGCCMDLPQEMRLKTVNGALRLCAWPAREIENLYRGSQSLEDLTLSPESPVKLPVESKACDLELEFPADASLALSLFGLELNYASGALTCGEKSAPVRGENGLVHLRILMDTLSAEIFGDSGSVFLGIGYIQDRSLNTLRLSGTGTVRRLTLRELGRFWEE